MNETHIIYFWGGPWDGKHGDMKTLPRRMVYPYDFTGHYVLDTTVEEPVYRWRIGDPE